ncbi:MAG: hypothetical protein HYV33_02605 [Candidatus Kerfeldbacteria bacterium]|nr:hypothetical protein [Candidatus Kerfeldbacteria bacterium]
MVPQSYHLNKWIKYVVTGLLAALFFSINFIPYQYNCADRQTQLFLNANEQPTYERHCADAMGFPLKWFTLESSIFNDTSQNTAIVLLVLNGMVDVAVAIGIVFLGWRRKI